MQNGDGAVITWSAKESGGRKRGTLWYLLIIGVILALAGGAFLIWWFTDGWQFWTTVGLAIVIFVTLIIINKQSGQTIGYSLDDNGVTINSNFEPYDSFRAFSVTHDGQDWTVNLIPVKRMSLETTLFVPKDKGEAIVDMLGKYLPMEDSSLHFVDQLSDRFKL